MSSFADFPPITAPDPAIAARARELRVALPLSFGLGLDGLGVFEDLASWFAACQGQAPARSAERATLLVVGGSHRVAAAHPQVSFLPEDFDAQVSEHFFSGAMPAVWAAGAAGVGVEYINADLAATSPEVTGEPVLGVAGSAALPGEALSSEACGALLEHGRGLADREADAGTDVLLLGDISRGVTTTAAAVVGAICSIEPVKVVGWGSGISDEAWKIKTAAIRDAMFQVRDDRAAADRVLRRIGSPDLLVLTGILAQAAARRTPVIFDGVGVAAAALCAHLLAPGASLWWRPASTMTEPGFSAAISALELKPVLDLKLGTGQGLGAIQVLGGLRGTIEALA